MSSCLIVLENDQLAGKRIPFTESFKNVPEAVLLDQLL